MGSRGGSLLEAFGVSSAVLCGSFGFRWEAWGSSGEPLEILGVPFGMLLKVFFESSEIPGVVWGAFVDPWGPYKPQESFAPL